MIREQSAQRAVFFSLAQLVFLFPLFPSVSGAATTTWTGGVNDNWFDGGNWDSGVPGNGDEAVIGSGTVLLTNSTASLGSLTMNGGTLTCSNWTTKIEGTNVSIQSGATISLPGAFSNAPAMSNRVWIACTNFFLASGASINANAAGYSSGTTGQGPGGSGSAYAGGGYGGFGGNYSTYGNGGNVYGSANAPLDPGSGGGGATGGSGGGAVLIEAPAGTVTVSGTITANGGTATGSGGGGSGGSVYITCKRLTGTNGTISAEGGSAPTYGRGGGGRIAVVYDPATQSNYPVPSLTFSVRAPAGSYASDVGTLYFPDNQLLANPIVHSGQWLVPNATNFTFNALTVSNAWIRFPQDGTAITVSNNLLINGSSARLELGGNAAFSNNLDRYRDYSGNRFVYSAGLPGPTLRVGGSLVITNSGSFYVYSGMTNAGTPDYGALVSVTNDIIMNTGCSIYPVSHPTNGGSVLFRAQNFLVLTGATLNANGMGYAGGGAIVGSEWGRTGFGAGGGGDRSGAGYGGYGGNFGNIGGLTYGSASAPLSPGSGGGGQGAGLVSGAGGGLVRMEVSDTVTVNGTVAANGIAMWNNNSGGGAGGGGYITCNILAGTNGSISADGGNVGGAGGAGGGGRIAVIYNSAAQSNQPLPGITFSAKDQGASSYRGDLGTLYFPDAQFLTETIAHSGQWLAPGTNWSVNTLTVNGWFRFPQEEFQLTVTNNILISGSSARFELGGGNFLTNQYRRNTAYDRFIYSVGIPSLICGGNLTLTNSAKFYVYAGETNPPATTKYGALVNVSGNMIVGTNCSLYPVSHPTNGGSVYFQVGNFTLASNATISADMGGYAGGLPTGLGSPNGLGPGGTINIRGGGSYGGTGGYLYVTGPYGSSNAPSQCGSGGGGNSAISGHGGTGGGLVWLSAAGQLILDGTITANGGSTGGNNSGAGSGGGIYLICRYFSGGTQAVIRANGGTSTSSIGGGGGGGRVAVWWDARNAHAIDERLSQGPMPGAQQATNPPSSFMGTTTADYGTSPASPAAQPGTVLFIQAPPAGTVFTIH